MFVHPHPKYARKNNHTPYALTRTTATRHYLQTHGACVDGHTRHTHHIRHMCKPAARVRGRRRPATTAAVLDREGHAWFRTSSPPSPGYCICGGGAEGVVWTPSQMIRAIKTLRDWKKQETKKFTKVHLRRHIKFSVPGGTDPPSGLKGGVAWTPPPLQNRRSLDTLAAS